MSADSGVTLLHIIKRFLAESVKNGNEARVVETLDKKGWHIIHAAQAGEAVLERNANPDEKSLGKNETPLHISAGHGDEESCALLISYGCTGDAVDVAKRTPLYRASLQGKDDVVKLLIKHNADVNRGDGLGWRPLHVASLTGQTSTVEVLANAGADIDCQSNYEETPLHCACEHGHTATVKLLVVRGADVDVFSEHRQQTALSLAVAKGHLRTACILLSSIPHPTLVNKTLQRHLELALKRFSMRLELLSFVCAFGALDGADDKVKSEAVEFAVVSIPHNSCLSHSFSLDCAFLREAFKLAERNEAVLPAVILAAAGAFRDSFQDAFAGFLRRAIMESRVELAAQLLRSVVLKVEEKKLLCDIFAFAGESTLLALAGLHHTALPEEGIPLPLRNKAVGLVFKYVIGSATVEFVVDLCKAGALKEAGTHIMTDVLAFALQNKSVELASIVVRTAGVLPEEHALHFMEAAADVAFATSSVALAILTCHRQEFSTASTTMVNKILQLGLDSDSIELVLAVVSKGAAYDSIPSDTLLKFAVEQKSSQLAMLVCNAGAVRKADHQLLGSVLEMAIEVSSNELLLLLCKAGVLQRSSDKVKEKTLHHAAMTGDLQLTDQCISSGVLRGADHWDKPTAIDIATRRGHSRLAEKLKKALGNHKLLSLGQRNANTVLIRVVGSPGAGKSTLVKSLRRSRLASVFRRENQADEDDRNFKTRTRGIKVKSYEDSNGTQYRILDLGGQEDFAAANQLFIGEGKVPIVNIITISSLKHYLEMEGEVLKWSVFFASRKDNCTAQQEASSRQPVIFAATRSESAGRDQVDNVRKAARQAEVSFGKFLDFRHETVFVDARKSWSHGMEKLRRLLADVTKEVLQGAPPQAALCNDIQRALPRIRAMIRRPIISRKELPELVAQGLSSRRRSFDQSVIESHTDLLDAALQQMSDACEVLSFDAPELKDVLVIQPPWLLHQVVGVLLSPANFPPPRLHYDRNGRAKRKQAEEALKANFGPLLEQYATLHMVAELGLCILDEEQDEAGADEHIVVPCKLENSRDLQAILLAEKFDAIWFGIELLCSEVPLSVCLFPQLQVHLHNYLRKQCKQKPIMWSGGIAVALSHHQVVGIVEARHGRMAIDIITQGTKATRRACYCLLQTLKEQTLFKIEKFSPGSDIREKILSSRELSEIDWSKSHHVPKITYERDYAEKAIEHGQIRPHHEDERLCLLEDAFELMAIPQRHISLMTTDGYQSFCHEINCPSLCVALEKTAKWQVLARRLGMPRHRISSINSAGTTNPADVLLQWWSCCSAEHTIDRLLAVVKGLHLPEAAAILEKELTYSLNILPGEPAPPSSPSADSESPGDRDDGPSLPIPSPASMDEHSSPLASVLGPKSLLSADVENPVSSPAAAAVLRHRSPLSLSSDFITGQHPSASCIQDEPKSPYSSSPAAVAEHSPVPFPLPFSDNVTAPSSLPAHSKENTGASPLLDSVTEHSSAPDSAMADCLPFAVKDQCSDQSVVADKNRTTTAEAAEMKSTKAAWPGALICERSLPDTPEEHAHDVREEDCDVTTADMQLLEVAKTFFDTFECKQLAVYLKLSEGGRIVSALQSTNSRMAPQEMAYEILMTWRKEKGSAATSKELRRVLCDKLKKVDAVEKVWPSHSVLLTIGGLEETPDSTATRGGLEETPDSTATRGGLEETPDSTVTRGGLEETPDSAATRGSLEETPDSTATSGGLEETPASTATRGGLEEMPDSTATRGGLEETPVSTATSGGSEEMPAFSAIVQYTHSLVDKVPETAIMDTALGFSDKYSCKDLAVYLELSRGAEFVENLNPHATSYERAYDVMMEWKKEKGSAATGEWLYKVLHDQLKMEDLAWRMEEALRRSD